MTCMTVEQIASELKAIQTLVGPRAEVHASIYPRFNDGVSIGIYPLGISNPGHLYAKGATWAAVFECARAKWAEHSENYRNQVVRKMALEIIRITADLGECSDAALRAEFPAEEVARYGEQAVAEANEIAGNGPFSIVAMAGSNQYEAA